MHLTGFTLLNPHCMRVQSTFNKVNLRLTFVVFFQAKPVKNMEVPIKTQICLAGESHLYLSNQL